MCTVCTPNVIVDIFDSDEFSCFRDQLLYPYKNTQVIYKISEQHLGQLVTGSEHALYIRSPVCLYSPHQAIEMGI